jgi:hypothetical protein
MSDDRLSQIRQLADALCEHLSGEWSPTDSDCAEASLVCGECELHLCGVEQNGTARLNIQAQLPAGWGAVEGITPPEITVRADRGAEAIAADITRRLLPLHAERAARVHTALELEARRTAVAATITDHFLARMPGAIPDPHFPATASSSSGPDRFSASLRVGRASEMADLHLRDMPFDLVRGVVDLVGRQLGDTEQAMSAPDQVLDRLADAITALASERRTVSPGRLLSETALNVLILSRLAANGLDGLADRERIDDLASQLVAELRHEARRLPVTRKPD